MNEHTICLNFFGAKGGVGTSTLAAISAAALRQQGHAVAVEGSDDLGAILGGWEDDPRPSIVVSDDRVEPHHEVDDATHVSVLVVRNDYLSLRRAIHTAQNYNLVVCVTEEGRALTIGDVASALGVAHRDLVAVLWSRSVAREVDAGLISLRPPRSAVEALQPILDRVTELVEAKDLELNP